MATYKNTFYREELASIGSKPTIETDSLPFEYKGLLIYERIKKICFDVVKDNICIGMYAGINGAKSFTDKITQIND